MSSWFTVEKIDKCTFAISEYKHWEETHCYLLLRTECAVLIDTGLGVSNIKRVVDSLTSLPVFVITTHIHWDHIGGHQYFKDFAVYENEINWLSEKFPIPLQVVKNNLTLKLCDFPSDFCLDDYSIFIGTPTRILHNGDQIDLGNRTLEVIHTPGHSPGHCCFYEADRQCLYSGDLIYKGYLVAFYPTTNPQQFYQSVKKVKGLKIEKVLPSHHQLSIPVCIIDRIENAFCKLEIQNNLEQGNGIFDFGDFKIHI